MVEHVQQAAGKTEAGHDRVVQGHAEHAETEPDHDDADILDAVIGEQSLDIVFAQGIDDAECARGHAEHQNRLADQQILAAE